MWAVRLEQDPGEALLCQEAFSLLDWGELSGGGEGLMHGETGRGWLEQQLLTNSTEIFQELTSGMVIPSTVAESQLFLLVFNICSFWLTSCF